ncbi:AraC family transcriptional regulator [Chryseobacterium shigense]|uniref:AraC-type DNA-binding protein n=1 Tax=Chryseobacterium shigense TaxID=297244 RepID=A0A1N7I8B7_9FLAO|nr:AraC family transcriptional regulator [Chryseobacterium shigense]PQA96983.1 AraC family transcriptional regulator [Chryseobacterium shigense]SIS33317.1 AraC-type DNA-binding protein [Chryseobacterium shigense]
MKSTMAPGEMLGAPYYHNFISLNGVNIVESCTHTKDKQGTMYIDDHLLLFVLEGSNKITYGNQSYLVKKNEMVLLHKNINFAFHKIGNKETDNSYDSMYFFLKDEFLVDFMKMGSVISNQSDKMARVTVKEVKEPLLSFITSIKPHFNEPEKMDKGLVRLKIIELLYDLAQTDEDLLQQLLQLKKQVISDISQVIEENYMNPLNLEDFAYLSGRSLSSFKRDFYTIYKVSPAQYIREKRMNKAKDLLSLSNLPVADVCYATGFETVSHFSRAFKKFFGQSPSEIRSQNESLI